MELLQCYPTSSSSDDGDEGEGEVDTVPSSGAKIPRAREVFSSSAGAKAESTETRVEERPEKRQRMRTMRRTFTSTWARREATGTSGRACRTSLGESRRGSKRRRTSQCTQSWRLPGRRKCTSA